MSNRTLSIYIKDKECFDIDEYLDGTLVSDDAFTTFSIPIENFYKRNRKDNFNKLIDKVEWDIDIALETNLGGYLSTEKQILEEMKKSKPYEFFNTFDAITFVDAPYSLIKTAVENNLSFFQNKKYVLSDVYNMSLESEEKLRSDIIKIKSLVKGWNPEILIRVEGNTLPVSIEDYYASFNIIQDIVTTVNSLNLSTLEKIMFVYDVVKKRKYNKETKSEEAYDSRDFTSSLLGDKIVCAGFNVIFDTILNMLGIATNEIVLTGMNGATGHVRTAIYVNDPKYHVKGNYFFDVTGDSKTDEKSPNRYRFFMKRLEEMLEIDRKESLYFKDDKFLYPNFIYEVLRNLKDKFTYTEFLRIGGRTRFNRFLKNMGEKTICLENDNNDKKELLSAYKKIYDSFNIEVNPLDFANLLYNVKRLEYYLNPSETPFSVEDLASSIISNTLPNFRHSKKEINLLSTILGISAEEIERIDRDNLLRETITPKMKHDIASIKLIRTLRETLLKK